MDEGTATQETTSGDKEVSSSETNAVENNEAVNEEVTPDNTQELLKQVSDLTGKLQALTKENEDYKGKEQQATRAQQSREETLEQDLTEAQQTIEKMDQIIRYTAIINAIQSNADLEFHSSKHVMRELNPEAFELDVDLENGTATVTGIQDELKRIARECDWLVKKNGRMETSNTSGAKPKVKASGAPPAPPGANGSKTNRRNELGKRFPVIMHNRGG